MRPRYENGHLGHFVRRREPEEVGHIRLPTIAEQYQHRRADGRNCNNQHEKHRHGALLQH